MKPDVLVLKFGGTSLGSIDRIQAVARRIQRLVENGVYPVVVVSAMSGETNRLVNLTKEIGKVPQGPEYDFVISSGEQVAAGLLALSLKEKGVSAAPLMGFQAGLQTDSKFSKAHIEKIDLKQLLENFKKNIVSVVTGFQGMTPTGAITTLGRGGSDTTAVAIAAAFKQSGFLVRCEIFTDVDGVFSADPRLIEGTHKLEKISYSEMLEMSSAGSKVMHVRSIEIGAKHGVDLCVRSSFNENKGTEIVFDINETDHGRVRAIATDEKVALIQISRLPNRSGVAYEIYGLLNDYEVSTDFMSQADLGDGLAQINFLVSEDDAALVEKLFETRWALSFHDAELKVNFDVVRLSLIGLGILKQTEIQKKTLQIFSELKVDIQAMSHTDARLGFVFSKKDLVKTLGKLHHEFFGIPSEKHATPEITQKS